MRAWWPSSRLYGKRGGDHLATVHSCRGMHVEPVHKYSLGPVDGGAHHPGPSDNVTAGYLKAKRQVNAVMACPRPCESTCVSRT